ncbi:hypothetical protein ASD44_03515 [Mesorhizobium sp. Root554]|uniref:transporter substrate-binding domain-containing protein n=1 Tax=unclassified Mesorhizobium TaxID=325217 RepID=UPI0006F749CF|nr:MULTISPECIES: transporter substrate-binding domain-containing protein [unclassified Mesorhizobium]KQZ13240.1 hypothetical protein ASD27_03520 [Mesorhizobium sp. Root1471]KQZ35754.1 hypothetical protein ASD44_03515 [Mesorhizobium sp. Root554]
MILSEHEKAAILAELAPTGKLRFALNHGNAVLVNPGSTAHAPSGVSVDLAEAFAAALGVAGEFVHYSKAGDVSDSVAANDWDVCFLAIDPLRAQDIAFTEPYVAIDGNFMVPAASPVREAPDIERLGLTVGVTRGSAYSLCLLRESRRATIKQYDSAAQVTAGLVARDIDAMGGVRQAMQAVAAANTGCRIVEPPFMSILQAVGTRTGRPLAQSFADSFVREMKASGFVKEALERHGSGNLRVPASAGV